jgi:hypothetical protein
MDTLAVLAFVWALIYAMLFLPARKAGAWIARPVDGLVGTSFSILCCFVLAWGVVIFVWLALKVGGREIVFSKITADYFRLPYVAVVLLVPTFFDLITGYLHARMMAGRPTLVSLLPANFKGVLANLVAFAASMGLLSFAGWSWWHEKTALRSMSLVVPLMVVLVLNFIVERSSLTKSLKTVTRLAVLIVAVTVSYYWVRTTS